jgi:HrpA-like RNA helicase
MAHHGGGRGGNGGRGGGGKPFTPVSEHTVAEDMRIRFTRMLMKLREDTVKEVVFPSDLTNIERKFLHKLAEELGLKSKSHGKGEDRRITVTKPSESAGGGSDSNDREFPQFTLKPRTLDVLQKNVSSIAIVNPYANAGGDVSAFSTGGSEFNKPSSIDADAAAIRSSYTRAQAERQRKPAYASMQRKREGLPAFVHQDAVTSLIKQEQIVLVSGETGCGKTTQVPQFLLDDPEIGPQCRIVVTQPRRLSAISVAERIAAERGEAIGGTIGYNIRLESEKSRTTQVLLPLLLPTSPRIACASLFHRLQKKIHVQVLFVTPGVLLRKLQSDPTLEEFSHVIIDEAHERDRFTEFLLIVLRRVAARRNALKLVLMSATMQTNKLSSYFGNVPHIHIGGSVFPVQEFFLEHVLRFTDYVSKLPAVDTSGPGGRGKDNGALAAYLRR